MLTCWKLEGFLNDVSDLERREKKQLEHPGSKPGLTEQINTTVKLTNVCFCSQVKDHVDFFSFENVIYQP